MKKSIFLLRLLAAVLVIGSTADARAQVSDTTKASPEKVKQLREAVIANPGDLKAHEAYLKTFPTALQAKAQYDEWMKKYPQIAAVPFAIGKKLSDQEDPAASRYLLKAGALQPKNAEIWNMLALDAERWGSENKAREFYGKAMVADPTNPDFADSYALTYESDQPEVYEQKIWELVDRYPRSSKGVAGAISYLGYETGDVNKKIAIYERLRQLFPPDSNFYTVVAMWRLCYAYIRVGAYRKAIALAASIKDDQENRRFYFKDTKQLAESLLAIDSCLKTGSFEEAKQAIAHLVVPGRADVGSQVLLAKAAVLDVTGETQAAYDSLITFQSKTPDTAAQAALEIYGRKLGRNVDQVSQDVRTMVEQHSIPAPPFELTSYSDHKKVRLQDLKGKVVFITFWFPGCGPCRAEMPHLQKIIDRYGPDQIVYLGINTLPNQDEYVLPFMKNTRYTFTALSDGDKAASQPYKIRWTPENFIIDQNGNIAYTDFLINADNEDTLDLMLKTLIKK